MDKQAVLEILRSNVDRTREEYDRSKEGFWRDSTDLPTGLPQRARSAAAVAYANALRRFNQFLLDGAIPEDLADSGQVACQKTRAAPADANTHTSQHRNPSSRTLVSDLRRMHQPS
jgi:hypothetical protein